MAAAVGRSTPASADVGRTLRRSLAAFAAAVTAAALLAAVIAPPDAVQGQWQRLMYVHVPAAWVAYAAFFVVLVASLLHLRRGSRDSDRFARAAAEIGVVCTAITLLAGSVWGHAVWGVWWAWDPRLVSTALMFTVYLAYLGLRGLAGPAPVVRLRAAVFGVIGFVVVPVVHFSVVWWRSLHQTATVLGPPTQAPPLDPRMAVALALAVLAATAVALVVLVVRVDALRRADLRAAARLWPAQRPAKEQLAVPAPDRG